MSAQTYKVVISLTQTLYQVDHTTSSQGASLVSQTVRQQKWSYLLRSMKWVCLCLPSFNVLIYSNASGAFSGAEPDSSTMPCGCFLKRVQSNRSLNLPFTRLPRTVTLPSVLLQLGGQCAQTEPGPGGVRRGQEVVNQSQTRALWPSTGWGNYLQILPAEPKGLGGGGCGHLFPGTNKGNLRARFNEVAISPCWKWDANIK